MQSDTKPISGRKIWHDNVKNLTDDELYRVFDYLEMERRRLENYLLSREGVVLDSSSVLPHTETLWDAA
jgi:hypothetical protein